MEKDIERSRNWSSWKERQRLRKRTDDVKRKSERQEERKKKKKNEFLSRQVRKETEGEKAKAEGRQEEGGENPRSSHIHCDDMGTLSLQMLPK